MGLVQNRRRFRGRPFVSALLASTFMAGVACLAGPALDDGHLEEENAALRSMIEDLRQEVEILKGMVIRQNEKIAEAAAPATPAKMVKSGKDKVSLSVSGQVNRMLLYASDGRDSRVFHADNDQSSTRVRFKGKATLDDEWSAGATFEAELESNSSSSVEIKDTGVGGDSNKASLKERKLELFFKSKRLGKLSLGQGSTASDGSTEEDLSGTGVITSAGFGGTGGSLQLVRSDLAMRKAAENSEGKVFTVGALFSNYDGLSRKDRVRYDTPGFGGVKLSTSFLGGKWNDDDSLESGAWDAALRYGRAFDGVDVAAAAATWKKDKDTEGRGGSLSVLAPSGTSLSLSYSTQDEEGQDSTFQYAKLGQTFDATSAGKTAVSIGYGRTEDQGGAGNENTYYDLAAVQKIKNLGAELYAVWGVYKAEIPGTPTEDITIFGTGARIKF